jgi:hypothetical protein
MTTFALVLIALLTSACGTTATQSSDRSTQGAPEDRLTHIPETDVVTLRKAGAFASWANPKLIVHPDGVELVPNGGVGQGPHLSIEAIEAALATLPRDAWPLGRAVSVQENGLGSGPSQSANLTALLAMLETHRVFVNHVPTA